MSQVLAIATVVIGCAGLAAVLIMIGNSTEGERR